MGVTPNAPHCPPWLTASSKLSSWSPSKSPPQPSCPRGHQLMTRLTPSLRVVPPPVPSPQATASAEVPERVHHLFVSLWLLQPLKHSLFSHSGGNKSNEKNDCAICSPSFSPALARQFVSLTLSDTIPWAAAGKPSNLGAFPIPYGLSPAQGALQEVCNLKKKHQGASLRVEARSKGRRICFCAGNEVNSGSKLLHGLESSWDQLGVLRTPKATPVIQRGATNDITGVSREGCGHFAAQKKGWTSSKGKGENGLRMVTRISFSQWVGWEINRGD